MNPPAAHRLAQDVANHIDELLAMACPQVQAPGLLVALSGGPDSVALLHLARRWADRSGAHLAAAHLHHGLRGADADADADFCRRLCADLAVPVTVEQVDLRPIARSRGQGLEEAGRHARRGYLARLLADDDRLDAVATGHHLDDQAETVIMRLFRGTGLDGLAGIRPVQAPYIRPLLHVARRELVAYLESVGQPWRTDATNLDGDNVRARLRRELLPVVRSIFGDGAERLPARLADLAAGDTALLDQLTDTTAAELISTGPDGLGLDIPGLLALNKPLARRILRRFLSDSDPGADDAGSVATDTPTRDLGSVHIDGVLAWLAGGTSGTTLDLPGGCELRREFDRLVLGTAPSPTVPRRTAADYRILVRKAEITEAEPHLGDHADGQGPPEAGPWRLTVPADCLRGSVRARNWRQGDRFQPLGCAGTKKLSDLLRERRVPAGDRSQILVVEDDEGLLWVVGLARDERTRLLPGSDNAVTIYLAERNPASGPNGNGIQGNESE